MKGRVGTAASNALHCVNEASLHRTEPRNNLRLPSPFPPQARHSLNLDYDALVQPWRCEQTVTGEVYTNRERAAADSALRAPAPS